MGFPNIKNELVRRIDDRFVSWKIFYYSLLHFTGSMEFNRNMRTVAKDLGYKLSEYGIYDNNTRIKIYVTGEKDILCFLNMKYLETNEK